MKILIYPIIGLLSICALTVNAQENNDSKWTSARPDGHAPISIMGDHTHHKNEIMVSYRYMPMWMKGNLKGDNEISNSNVFENYMVSPQEMKMDMHMLGIMYAPTSKLTLSVMANYTTKSMDLKTRSNIDFTTKSEGFGDITVAGIYNLYNKKRQVIHANFGVSLPTGDIDQRDATPMADNVNLAYPMQIGSGTVDPFLGATYFGQSNIFSWGAQSTYKFRIDDNSEGYTLGNELKLNAWGAIKASKYFSFSGSLSYKDMDSIKGQDDDIAMMAMMMPLFNTANSGRNQLDVGIGSNFYIPSGALKNLRLAAEVKFPVHQEVTGVQMENTVMATFGIQYAIGH